MKIITLIFSILVLFLTYQNCSDAVHFKKADNITSDFSEDDNTEPENCEEGTRLAIWLDPNNSGDIQDEWYLGSIQAFQGELDSISNYNYYSA